MGNRRAAPSRMRLWVRGRSLPVRVLLYAALAALVFALAVGAGVVGALALRGEVVGLLAGDQARPTVEQDTAGSSDTGGQAESQLRLMYTFERGILTEPSGGLRYVDDAPGSITGNPHRGYLRGVGGAISLVPDPTRGLVAKFPEPCAPTDAAGCPKAMIRTDAAQSDDLNPRSAPFAFGAAVLIEPTHLTGGSNIVQKGLYDEPGGQWKLQVDSPPGTPGRPSCSVTGVVDGEPAAPIYVRASGANVADGGWHRVVCRRTAGDRLGIIVDGVWENSKPVPQGAHIRNDAPVSIGAKHLDGEDNDQFHGTLNRVFFSLD